MGRTDRVFQAGGVVLLILVALASLTWPFGWDQGIFAAVGRTIVDGGVPYRDAWDIKGPLTHYVYAVSHLLFGPSLWGIRLMDAGFTAATAWGITRIGSRWMPSGAARTAGIAYALWYASGTYWHTAQPDAWAGGLLVGTVLLLAPGGPRPRLRSFGAGVLAGMTVLIKPHYLGFGALPVLAAFLHRDDRVARAMGAGVGLLLPPTLAVAWFAAHGALPDLWYAYLEWPLTAYAGATQLPLAAVIAQLGDYLLPWGILLIAAPAIAAGLAGGRTPAGTNGIVIVVWAVITVGAVAIQRRFFDYHWTVALPPLTLLVAHGLWRMFRAAAGRPIATAITAGYAILLAIRLAIHPVWEVGQFVTWQLGIQPREAYEAHFGIGGVDLAVARSLRQRMSPSDQVTVFGPNAGIGYLSGGRSPTRFVWNTPLILGEQARLYERFRREYLDALTQARPRFFVESTETGSVVPDYPGLAIFPELEALVRTEYRLERTVGHLRVFERVDP